MKLEEKLRRGRWLLRGLGATAIAASVLIPIAYKRILTIHAEPAPVAEVIPTETAIPTHVETAIPTSHTIYSIGAYKPDGERLKEHLDNLAELDIPSIPEHITQEDGTSLVRIAIPKDERLLPQLKEYAAKVGAGIAEITIDGDSITAWNTLEEEVRQTVDTYHRNIMTDGRFPYQDIVERTVEQVWTYGTPEERRKKIAFVGAVMEQESHFDASTKPSKKGALGLMQVMPGMVGPIQKNALGYKTTRISIERAVEPEHNILLGTALLKYDNEFCKNLLSAPWDDPRTLECTAAAYNAGERAASRYVTTHATNRETRAYVPRVQERFTNHMRNMK